MTSIHVRSAWSNIRRSPFQALAAIFVLSITFFVTTVLAVFVYSSSELLSYFETRPQVIAFLKDSAKDEEIFTLQSKLQNDYRVKDIKYVTKEQALELYKKATSDNPLLSELVSPSIFPASLEFSLTNLNFAEEVINEMKNESVVDEIGFTASLGGESTLKDVVTRLRNISYYVRVAGGSFVVLLMGTSFLVLLIIIGMRMNARRGEIEILQLIGATPGFIRLPILIEAVIYGIVGVFMGWLIALLIFLYATPSLLSYFGEIPILPSDVMSLLAIFGVILGGEIVIGLLLSFVGSMIAVSRIHRKR